MLLVYCSVVISLCSPKLATLEAGQNPALPLGKERTISSLQKRSVPHFGRHLQFSTHIKIIFIMLFLSHFLVFEASTLFSWLQ